MGMNEWLSIPNSFLECWLITVVYLVSVYNYSRTMNTQRANRWNINLLCLKLVHHFSVFFQQIWWKTREVFFTALLHSYLCISSENEHKSTCKYTLCLVQVMYSFIQFSNLEKSHSHVYKQTMGVKCPTKMHGQWYTCVNIMYCVDGS